MRDKESFFPFIDKYGQYKHGDWPQKIKNDQQLISQIQIEDQDLNLNTISEEWSKNGGYKQDLKLKGTRHFRPKRFKKTVFKKKVFTICRNKLELSFYWYRVC